MDAAAASCSASADGTVDKQQPRAQAQPVRAHATGSKVKTFTRKPTVTAAAARRERCRKRHFLKKSIARVQDMNPEAQQAAYDEVRGTGPVRAVGMTGITTSQALIAPVAPRPLDTQCTPRRDRSSMASRSLVLRPWQDAAGPLRAEARAAVHSGQGAAQEQQSQPASSSAQTTLPPPRVVASGSGEAQGMLRRVSTAAAAVSAPIARSSSSEHLHRLEDSGAHSIASGLRSPEFDDLDMFSALPRLSDSSAMAESDASSPSRRLSGAGARRSCSGRSLDGWGAIEEPFASQQGCQGLGNRHGPVDDACSRALRRYPSRAHSRAGTECAAVVASEPAVTASLCPIFAPKLASPLRGSADLRELLQRLPDSPRHGVATEDRPLPLFSSPIDVRARRLHVQQHCPTDSGLSASLDTQAVMAALSAREASGDLCCSPQPSAPSSPLFKAAQQERIAGASDAPSARRNGLDFGGAAGEVLRVAPGISSGLAPAERRSHASEACTRDPLHRQRLAQAGAAGNCGNTAMTASLRSSVHVLCTTMMLSHLEYLGLSPSSCEPWLDDSGRIASHMLRMDCVPPEANRDMAFLPVDGQVRSLRMNLQRCSGSRLVVAELFDMSRFPALISSTNEEPKALEVCDTLTSALLLQVLFTLWLSIVHQRHAEHAPRVLQVLQCCVATLHGCATLHDLAQLGPGGATEATRHSGQASGLVGAPLPAW